MNETHAKDRQIISTRVFKAPRELLWKVIRDPAHLAQWWGPKGFTNNFHTFDFRVGGVWEFDMIGPNAARYPNKMIFAEISEPDKLVLDHVSGHRFILTMLFEKVAEGTKLTWIQTFESVDDYVKIKGVATPGNEENFDRLEKIVASLA